MSELALGAWDFLAHPAFAVFEQAVRARLATWPHFPAPSELSQLGRDVPRALEPWFEFAAQDQAELDAAGGYDRAIAKTSRIPTRVGSFHDLLGALIWLHFPALKTAIHQAQSSLCSGLRGPRENAATLCDESGVLVLSREPRMFEALAGLAWVDLFWTQRRALAESTRFVCFGHGLLDALRARHPRLMGKALFVRVSAEQLALEASALRVFIDGALAPRLSAFLGDPERLAPLPVLGVPGWAPAQTRAFYEDTSYFMTARARPRPARAPAWLDLSTG
jgi:hypothetical protein